MAEVPLTSEQIAKAEGLILARMQQGPFTFGALWKATDRALDLPTNQTTYRVADRLIQRERRAGRITQGPVRGDWSPSPTTGGM